jgi:hypothetical protein
VPNTVLRFESLDFVFDGLVESPAGAVFTGSQPVAHISPQVEQPGELRSVMSTTDQVWDLVYRGMAASLGPNPSKELFRFVVYATSMLVFGV